MILRTGIALFSLIASMNSIAAEKITCTDSDIPEIEARFTVWNNALQTGDAQQVAALYTRDAVLLPTVSNQVRLTNDQRVDYFEHFLEKKPVGEINQRTVRLGCNTAIDSGIYTFTFSDNTTIQARYTFTYDYVDNQWLISSHHSSAMPEGQS
ncbi:signal peptide protein [Mangrovibacter sp. MFB070]|uniref:SgcJ/EcaC family oxidoreductase n=1 Tax=Mangrovibacter sp. MFB070 TaxID=1224318 RepID=UPI0004D84F99|nr:signal peptide protein [Mangrovibacter sp. MFB070]